MADNKLIIYFTEEELQELVRKAVAAAVGPILSELHKPAPPLNDIISFAEGAKILGLKKATLYSAKSKGMLKTAIIKRGARLYYSKKALIAYLEAGSIMTNKELTEQVRAEISNRNSK